MLSKLRLPLVALALALLTLSPSAALANEHANSYTYSKRASGVTSDPTTAADQTFDYIVVGAGLAGVTVAARLAENSSLTILLLEAGNDDRTDPRVYDIYEYGQAFGTSLTWQWKTDKGRTIQG